MKVTRISQFTGERHTLDLPCTYEQFDRWEDGVLIQHAFPNLLPWQREFIMTGVTPSEWAAYMGIDEQAE